MKDSTTIVVNLGGSGKAGLGAGDFEVKSSADTSYGTAHTVSNAVASNNYKTYTLTINSALNADDNVMVSSSNAAADIKLLASSATGKYNAALAALAFDYVNECLTGFNPSTIEYALGGMVGTFVQNNDISQSVALTDMISQNGGSSFAIRLISDTSINTTLSLPSRADAPSVTIKAGTDDTKDIMLTFTGNLEYSLDDGASWANAITDTDINVNSVAGKNPGDNVTVTVRTPAVAGTAVASSTKTLTIALRTSG